MYKKFEDKPYYECDILKEWEWNSWNINYANKQEIESMLESKILKLIKGKRLVFVNSNYHGYILRDLKEMCDAELLYFCDEVLYICDPENKYQQYHWKKPYSEISDY